MFPADKAISIAYCETTSGQKRTPPQRWGNNTHINHLGRHHRGTLERRGRWQTLVMQANISSTLHAVRQEVAALNTIPGAARLWLSKTCLFLLQIWQQTAQHRPERCSTLTFCRSLSLGLCFFFTVLPLSSLPLKDSFLLEKQECDRRESAKVRQDTYSHTHPSYYMWQCASNLCVALLQLSQLHRDAAPVMLPSQTHERYMSSSSKQFQSDESLLIVFPFTDELR